MDIKIENYTDFENVTIAKFKEALAYAEKLAFDELAKGNFKECTKYGVLYIKLNNLLDKKITHATKNGYEAKRHSK